MNGETSLFSTILNNAIALTIILLFFLFVYAKMKNMSISEAVMEMVDLVRGKKDEAVSKGDLWRRKG